jgi:hypothetical protein
VLIERKELSAAIFMGDLTDIGNLGGYKSATAYIAGALQLGAQGIHSSLPTGVLPGNHDIDRNLAAQPGLATKFIPLVKSLSEAGLPPIPVSKTIWMKAGTSSHKAEIALLNSCWGCGAKEYIPAEFREDVANAIDAAINRSGPDKEKAVRAYYDRQFDTPAFSDEAITELAQQADEISPSSVLIACAHHNLLPQRLTRLAPYTELLNSGALRGTLQGLSRPIIYLHGHIHEDPIEVISTPGGSPLVCVSAPEASNGFNVLEFVFTRSGIPLSCHVIKWRFDDASIFRVVQRVAIPIIGQRTRAADRSLPLIYAHLLTSGDAYWSDLVAFASSIYSAEVEEQLEEAIELLAADGRVTISNYDLDSTGWIVGAKV